MSDLRQMLLVVAIAWAFLGCTLMSASQAHAQTATLECDESISDVGSHPDALVSHAPSASGRALMKAGWPIDAPRRLTPSSVPLKSIRPDSGSVGDSTPMPIPELGTAANQSENNPADQVVRMKPQDGLILPPTSPPQSISTAGGAAAQNNAGGANPYRNGAGTFSGSGSTPSFTGLSDQRAAPNPRGPTTAEIQERDNRWRNNIAAGQRPTTDRIAQRDLQGQSDSLSEAQQRFAQAARLSAQNGSGQNFDPNFVGPLPPGASRGVGYPPLPGTSGQSSGQASALGSNSNFANFPPGLGMPTQNNAADRGNPQSIGFNSNGSGQNPNQPTDVNASIAERNERLRQQQLMAQEAERQRMQLAQQQQQRAAGQSGQTNNQQQTPEQAAYQKRLDDYRKQQEYEDYQKRLAALATQPNSGQSTSSPWDPNVFNNGQATGNLAAGNRGTGMQPTGMQGAGNPASGGQGMGMQPGMQVPNAQTPNPYATATNTAGSGNQGQTAPGTQANQNNTSQRDVDPLLSEVDKQRLPANAWTFDDWGWPVDKGGRVLDRRGNPLPKEEVIKIRYPNLLAGQANASPDAAIPPTRVVSNRNPGEDDVRSPGDGRRNSTSSGIVTTKPRGFVAQSFFNGAMLVSIVANVYMIYWFKTVYVRYRELVAAQRVMGSPSSMAD